MSLHEPFQQVVIVTRSCANVYGVAPCTATVGTTGEQKCFNTAATCQDRPNLIATDKPITFCSQNENAFQFAGADSGIPSLLSASSLPATLNIAAASVDQGPLGRRASIKLSFSDHPHHDRGLDPYWSERTYNAIEQSTFWLKFIARNPYYEGFEVRVIDNDLRGILPQKIRYFLLEKIDLASNGTVSITAKDALSPIKDFKFPQVTIGQLVDDITASQTLIEISNGDTYEANGILRIEDEVMTFIRVGDLFAVSRAQYGTVAAEHAAEESVQQCLWLSGRVDVILYFILVLAGVPPAYIDYGGQWNVEASKWLASAYGETLLTKPISATQLIGELLEQFSCNIWFDERSQLIPLRAVRPVDPELDTQTQLNENANIVSGSVARKDLPEQRYDQIWFYYGKRSWIADDNEGSNFTRWRVITASQAQADYETESRPRMKAIYSRWIPQGGVGTVVTTATRILQRVAYTPSNLSFSLHAKDGDVWTGDVVELTTRQLIDIYGVEVPTLMQVISAEESDEGTRINYISTFFGLRQRSAFITPNDWPTYVLASEAQRLNGCFISDNDGHMPNGDPAYLLV